MANKIWQLPKRETELWVEALRSGKYKQGKSSLYNESEDSYCCLGVWCEIHYPEYKEDWKYTDLIELDLVPAAYELTAQGTLSSILAGLNDGLSVATKKCLKNLGIEIDDNKEDFTFDEIANFIEKYVAYI